jgi:hypothetical protein
MGTKTPVSVASKRPMSIYWNYFLFTDAFACLPSHKSNQIESAGEKISYVIAPTVKIKLFFCF